MKTIYINIFPVNQEFDHIVAGRAEYHMTERDATLSKGNHPLPCFTVPCEIPNDQYELINSKQIL